MIQFNKVYGTLILKNDRLIFQPIDPDKQSEENSYIQNNRDLLEISQK